MADEFLSVEVFPLNQPVQYQLVHYKFHVHTRDAVWLEINAEKKKVSQSSTTPLQC